MKNRNISRKKSFWNMHLTAIFSLSLVLFLVGLVSLLAFLAQDMTNYIRQNMTLSIVLTDSTDTATEQRIEKMLLGGGFAKELKFISKEDALQEHITQMGDNPTDFLGFNPLLASIEVKLAPQFAHTDSIARIEKKLSVFKQIENIVYQKDAMDLVNKNITRISLFLGLVALALLLISIVLINSTIRLMIYADRFLIRSMWLVGATAWFIRKPYIRHSTRNGFIAAVFACGLLAVFVWLLWHNFGLNLFVEKPLILGLVAVIVMLTGIFLTAILAFFAVGKYIRMKTDKVFVI